MRTIATFHSDRFNTTEEKDDFINPGCFGDDVAAWIAGRLRDGGVRVIGELGQEDFGWYLRFEAPEGGHCVVVGYDPEGQWVAWLERDLGLFRSLFSDRRSGIAPGAVRAIHEALQAPEIDDLRWHERADFDAGREELGRPEP